MVSVVGIDPGTVSFDLCGLADGQLFLDLSIPSAAVASDPAALVDPLTRVGPLDLIAGPSGYGLPLVPIEAVDERDLALLVLVPPTAGDRPRALGGLRRLLRTLREAKLPVVLLPGVIHLPTVPRHRKMNRIDLGTADKLCVAALAIVDQARRLGLPYEQTSLILVEVGGAFTAALRVEGGQIVDGVGGTSGPVGLRALGALDGELAYVLGNVTKDTLFRGGALDIAGLGVDEIDRFVELIDQPGGPAIGWHALLESIDRTVAGLVAATGDPREIILSGRLVQYPAVQARLADRLARYAPVRPIGSLTGRAKAAAQGAALIADGLAGGRYAPLVDALALRRASGTVLDYLAVPQRNAIRAAFGLAEADGCGS